MSGAPFIVRNGDMYYYCYTAYNDLYVACFKNLADIEKAEVKKVYDGCHSMHVLRSKTENIFGEYEFLGNMHGLENT